MAYTCSKSYCCPDQEYVLPTNILSIKTNCYYLLMFPGSYVAYAKSYCWIKNTYYQRIFFTLSSLSSLTPTSITDSCFQVLMWRMQSRTAGSRIRTTCQCPSRSTRTTRRTRRPSSPTTSGFPSSSSSWPSSSSSPALSGECWLDSRVCADSHNSNFGTSWY